MEDFSLFEDPNYSKPLVTNDVDFIKQEIDILFETNIGDLHGDVDFGTEYDAMLYEHNLVTGQLEDMMMDDMAKMNLLGFRPSVQATILPGTLRDIALIEVNLERGAERTKKIYRIE